MKVSLLELYRYTLRELFTLYIEINRLVIYENGKQIGLAGGKADQYIAEQLSNFDESDESSEFEIDENKLYKVLKDLK